MILFASGSGNGGAAFTVTTEHILGSVNIPGEFQMVLDANAFAAGDVLEVYVRQMVLTGGTKREAYRQHYHGAPDAWEIPIRTPWFANDLTDSGALEFCVKQSFGTGRTPPWKVLNKGYASLPFCKVVTDGGNTASTFKTDRTETATDHWKDAFATFMSGALIGQTRRVTAYNGTTKFLTVSAGYSAAPSANDILELVNR